jgi:serpin B
MAMGIVLPTAGTFDTFRKALTTDNLSAMINAAAPAPVSLELPKFTFDTSRQLKAELQQLGMTTAFDPGSAGLSGLPAKAEPLHVDAVVQKTHVAVDELGTTAAAASGVSVRVSAFVEPLQPAEMHVDRPFLFLIRDTVTGRILFLGQVTDPRG